MIKHTTVNEITTKKESFRASDFTGARINECHWSEVVHVETCFMDGAGNTRKKIKLDLTPKESADFEKALENLIDSFKTKSIDPYVDAFRLIV